MVVRMASATAGDALGSGLWVVRSAFRLLLWFGLLLGGFGGEGVLLFSPACILISPSLFLSIFGYILIQICLTHYAIYLGDLSVGFLHCVAKVSLLINYIQIASNISRRRIKTHKHLIQPFTSSRTDPRIRQGTVFISRFLQNVN